MPFNTRFKIHVLQLMFTSKPCLSCMYYFNFTDVQTRVHEHALIFCFPFMLSNCLNPCIDIHIEPHAYACMYSSCFSFYIALHYDCIITVVKLGLRSIKPMAWISKCWFKMTTLQITCKQMVFYFNKNTNFP